ncbi:MAG TPA: hypothetical protein ENJ39_03485 [Flammeovirgaceae bacterium]|nr:hypothetical protein [Flammeovirgaceae bacterium]
MVYRKQGLLTAIMMLTLSMFIACGKQEKQQENEAAEFDEAKEALKQNIEGVIHNIPSPAELPYLLEATGADFNEALINSKDNADKYMTTFDKAAMNLGVYAADIGYLSAYNQTQQALDYLAVAKQLSEHLGVVDAVDQVVMERFEKNIDQKDSLYNIINEAIENVDQYLKNEARNRVAALVTTGSFIEGLYIATELVRTYPKDLLPEDARNLVLMPIIRLILKQENSVGELIKLIDSLPEDDLTKKIKADLHELKSRYEALNIEEQIKNNQANLVLNDETLTTITEIVHDMRADIVQ